MIAVVAFDAEIELQCAHCAASQLRGSIARLFERLVAEWGVRAICLCGMSWHQLINSSPNSKV